ncbi:MAG TPA: FAD-dependent monooxygenase [Actinomycetota bacterium]|nr:FAD-dependent monooxygenase [Actinomycetota bacterium]
MRITVLGAGPAGLYFALLAKKANPAHDIVVIERNPPDATFGWGVVFSEETLGGFRDADLPTYTEITETFARWGAIDVRFGGEIIRSRGHVFSAIARTRLLQILQERCRELGVELRFHQEIESLGGLDGHDLLVAADGVNSLARRELAEQLVPSMDVHATKFAWFGTDLVFDAFTFIFREDDHGLFQVHGYPFDAETSTFIVECPEPVWRAAGLDGASEQDSIAFCERLFAEDLDGHRLLSNRSLWTSFVTLRCETWRAGNVVLLGDAAHTAHFTIGSGTKLAMEDAVSLAEALERRGEDVDAALLDYEMERQPVVERFQEAARESATYFENVRRYRRFAPLQFAFNLLTRSGRITHLELERRDPGFVARVDGWFARPDERRDGPVIVPPPALAPIRLRGLRLPNRVALWPVGAEDAVDGTPGRDTAARLERAARSGAALVLTDLVAVSAEGRITPGTPGLYEDAHVAPWRDITEAVHEQGATVAVLLGHAGPRGSTRPRRPGVDRSLGREGWAVIAASPVRFAPWGPVPEMWDPSGAPIAQAFARAAARAAAAGFDAALVHMGHGYLLASFLSPLTNRRDDAYGGSPDRRTAVPLAVFEAVREAWPEDRPAGAALVSTDWARGGFELDDAVAVAAALEARGCDLILPLAGQTTIREAPAYGRFYQVPGADRIRNEIGVPTMVGGGLATADEANTVLAAGRADLVIVELGI